MTPAAIQLVDDFDELIRHLKLKVASNAPLKQQADLVREMYSDPAEGSESWKDKWRPRIQETKQARIAVERFVKAVGTVKTLPGVPKILKTVLAGSITQDFQPTPAKDFFYELEVAASLVDAGFDVQLVEPDIVVRGNGLSRPVALACKYPSSRDRLHIHVSKGYKQILDHNFEGAVCLGLDLIVGKEENLSGILDFRRTKRSAPEIQFYRLADEVLSLMVSLKRDYPDELPWNGLIMTLFIAGTTGHPIRFENIRHQWLVASKEAFSKRISI